MTGSAVLATRPAKLARSISREQSIGLPALLFGEGGGTMVAEPCECGPRERFSGAAAQGARLAVVTISLCGSIWSIEPGGSFLAELTDRDQVRMRKLRGALDEAFRRAALDRCTFRAPSERGPYAARGLAFKIESALQLCEVAEIDLAAPVSVKSCESAAMTLLRGSPPLLHRTHAKLVLQATATAILAACRRGGLDGEVTRV